MGIVEKQRKKEFSVTQFDTCKEKQKLLTVGHEKGQFGLHLFEAEAEEGHEQGCGCTWFKL